jgi:hypothetical protein
MIIDQKIVVKKFTSVILKYLIFEGNYHHFLSKVQITRWQWQGLWLAGSIE